MRSILLITAAVLTIGAAPPNKLLSKSLGKPPALPTPNDLITAAPASAWKKIPADDLLVMELRGGNRVVIQLAPAFAPVHVANIKALARSNYWSGATIYRVQDNYVAQWGQNDAGKAWPVGVVAKPPAEYIRPLKGLRLTPLGYADPYAPQAGFVDGWPVAYSTSGGWADLAHCYASVGVGRDLSPDTGTGGELYAVIGQAPRQLDRNIALVGRVVDGIERLSSLPRGTEALGFYRSKAQYAPISSVRLASEIPPAMRPAYEYMDTGSAAFARYLKLRANRHDAFYIKPAGGVDLCNVQVPVRRKVAAAG